ncbi:hypothetical protein [Mycobacterium marseillense]|uniref:hypothetical protein n=1 Tax=Mycobacterium marseillense TaxID=701042 RepID=UPI0011A7FA97|nr:hypothetical protein [Mycobacterium marseillense]
MTSSSQQEPITGLVARVISNTKLVINRGREHGVQLGQIYIVQSREGEAIADPENNEIIGVLPVEKVRVKVTEVYDRMAVAETYRQKTVGGSGTLLSDVFGPPREVLETFQSDEKSRIAGDLAVRIKDPVRQFLPVKREAF